MRFEHLLPERAYNSIKNQYCQRGNCYKNDENSLRLMLRNASEHKLMELSTARLHVSSVIVFNLLKNRSAILFESFFIAE